jgi:low affinity Fe/Cu permease
LAKVDLLYYHHALKRRGLFDNVENDMDKLTNEQCRDQALIQTKLGNFINAMRWYNLAAARTIGHKKVDAYEAKAKWCAEMAGAAYDRCYYADDYEAVAEAA